MKSFIPVFFKVNVPLFFFISAFSFPKSGFYLPDSVNEMTLRYKTVENLIILPVVINDSIKVNLILDTGCRNLVLFGKKFQKLLKLNPDKQIQFSGLGSGRPVLGHLSLSNKASIHQVLGESIPVVVVPGRNVFGFYKEVDGVIGYDIFLKFEIELNPRERIITFRPAARALAPAGYAQVPLSIVDSRPLIHSVISIESNGNKKYAVMIDTGSSLGLLLKTTNLDQFNYGSPKKIIGHGFNGPISGFRIFSSHLSLDGFVIANLPTGIVESPWHNYASIGMEILKEYVLVLNYCKSYACFKKPV